MPIMSIVYDNLSAAFILTQRNPTKEDDDEYFKALNKRMENRKNNIFDQDLEIKFNELSKKVGIVDKSLYSYCISMIDTHLDHQEFNNRLSKYNVPLQSERAIFSVAIPSEFYYNYNNVVINEGILVRGIINKKILGSNERGIVMAMYQDLGGEAVTDLISNLSFVLNAYLENVGFTVGIKDCLPTNDKEFQDKMKQHTDETDAKVMNIINIQAKNAYQKKKNEQDIQNILMKSKNVLDDYVMSAAAKDNAFVVMGNAGAKGSASNFAFITSCLGQQMVNGERIQSKLPGARTLPIFPVGTKTAESNGFCYNSLFTGLSPSEMFMSAMGSREGSADTSIQTSNIGNLQRSLVKSNESIHISSEGSVINEDGSYVQFVYGLDGFSPAGVSRYSVNGELRLLPTNTAHLVNKLNNMYKDYIKE